MQITRRAVVRTGGLKLMQHVEANASKACSNWLPHNPVRLRTNGSRLMNRFSPEECVSRVVILVVCRVWLQCSALCLCSCCWMRLQWCVLFQRHPSSVFKLLSLLSNARSLVHDCFSLPHKQRSAERIRAISRTCRAAPYGSWICWKGSRSTGIMCVCVCVCARTILLLTTMWIQCARFPDHANTESAGRRLHSIERRSLTTHSFSSSASLAY
jgi:hypothetical protein